MLTGVTVGCGYFSRIQMEAWKRAERVQIVAACDVDRAKAEKFAQDFELRPYTDLDAMIEAEKPDFVDIVTRPKTHPALVEQAANRGLPILLQKPLAENWDEAQGVVETARKAGVRLMVNENWRWQAWYRKIQRMIFEKERIGKPFYYRMEMRNRDGLGDNPYPKQPYFAEMARFLVTETLVHHIDTGRFLFGDVEEVFCRTAKINPRIAGEDCALITLRHTNGVLGVIDGNRAAKPDEPGEVMGSSRFEGLEGAIRLTGSGDVWRGKEQFFWGANLPGYKGDSCLATQQHFVDCLESGEEFETEAGDYLAKTFAVVEACYRSAEANCPVDLRRLIKELSHPSGGPLQALS